MKFGSLMRLLVSVLLFLGGIATWNSRLSFDSETVIQSRLTDRLKPVSAGRSVDLDDECGVAKSGRGWILFVLDASLTNDNQFRTFFETAEERIGLWVEYDAGLLRLGLGLGPDSIDSNLGIPIRIVRKKERINVLIGVKQEETRVVSNALDVRTAWPGDRAPIWQCDSVQFADNSRELTEGHKCQSCDIRLRYATGRDIAELDSLLNSISNVRRSSARSWSGTVLSIVGGLVFLNVFPRFRRPSRANTRSIR